MKRISTIILLGLIGMQVLALNPTEKMGVDKKQSGKLFEQFELSVSEGFNFQASEKIGANKLYGIVSIGTQCFSDDYKWGFGAGIGTHLIDKENLKSNLEFVSYQVNEKEIWTNSYNGLQQLKLSFSKKLSDRVSVFAGPSFNLMVTRNKTEYVNPFDSTFAPYEIFKSTGDKSTLRGWIGLTAGLQFN